MGDVVNLKQFRKQKDREDRAEKAKENRRKYGQTKSEKELTEKSQDLEQKKLDGHKVDPEVQD